MSERKPMSDADLDAIDAAEKRLRGRIAPPDLAEEAMYIIGATARMIAEIRGLRAELAKFQRGTGCANGYTIGEALANIRRILRDGEKWPSPVEGIPDIAERVVRERNEARADAKRAAEEMRERAARAAETVAHDACGDWESGCDAAAAAIRALPTEPER